MKKFFVPSAWDKNTETLKFQSTKGNLSTPVAARAEDSSSGKKAKKNKPKKKKKDDATATPQLGKGKGPLAPSVLEKAAKVKTGRIEKRKLKKEQKQQKQKLTPALAKAVEESLNEATKTTSKDNDNDDDDDDDDEEMQESSGSTLEAKLKEQLMGGRFRYLNEQLYTRHSSKAASLFREDSDAFSAYHAGYRHQVAKWPLNPLDRIIKQVRRLPKTHIVGDFGCGEGKLAESVPNKVYSMDLVSSRDGIIACDMAHTPLQSDSLDLAVYCLSLMGTNLTDCLLEANRVLKQNGLMYIAEIQTRFDNVKQFVRNVEACGFQAVHKDLTTKVFYFFHFKKVRNVAKVAVLPNISLKPCLYRKR